MRFFGYIILSFSFLAGPQDVWSQNKPVSESTKAPSLQEIVRLRDPFRMPDLRKFKEEEGMKTELEQFPVNGYKMLGVVTGPDRYTAMLKGPNNKTYFVREGQRIGTQKGIIQRITPEAVVVNERVTNLLGTSEVLVTEIRLPVGKKIDVVGSTSKGDASSTINQQIMPTQPATGSQPLFPGLVTGESKKEKPETKMLDQIKSAVQEQFEAAAKKNADSEKGNKK